MTELFEIHKDLENQPGILDELIETPQLCMLLNPELTGAQIAKLKELFYVVRVENEGESRYAIV